MLTKREDIHDIFKCLRSLNIYTLVLIMKKCEDIKDRFKC